MRFYVVESEKRPKSTPGVVLLRDSWDDYGLKTSFKATFWDSDGSNLDLGIVKILQKGQSGFTRIPERFEQLTEDFCSLGQNLEYYEALRRLGRRKYEPLLRGLRDAVFSPLIRADFEDEPGFQDSLLRSTAATSALKLAPSFFSSSLRPPSSTPTSLHFKTSVGGSRFRVSFDFGDRGRLPSRVNVIIGYNGTGKTQLLANLAMAATNASDKSKDAESIQSEYGEFLETDISFGAVIAISYSAFDTFDVPGMNLAQRRRVARESELLGYTYCGLRKLSASRDSSHAQVKSAAEIADDFEKALETIRERERLQLFVEMLTPLGIEPSLQRIGVLGRLDQNNEEWRDLFGTVSSGHKIVLNIAAHLAAYLHKNSLVLIDEPETHLHPPLLAALLKCLRTALTAQDSYAIVATHSPVVLQETPSRFVHILRRFGESTSAIQPQSETFGENIGILTRDAFELNNSETDYHDVLESLARDLSIEEIERLFGRRLGFQARSYLVGIQRLPGA